MIATLDNVSKSFGSTLILSEISAQIKENDRIGFVGINGAGKSTLLNIIYGELDYDEGTVARSQQSNMGFLRQSHGLGNGTIQQEMERVFDHLLLMEQSMRDIELRMAEVSHESGEYASLSTEYSSLQTQFESAEGYKIQVKISTVLNGMGFGDVNRETPVEVLSGGETTRLSICKLLLEEPSLLILDEPTNHLDFKTLIWLEDYLSTYPGALLIVSHDRYFLNKVCNSMWELQNHELTHYKGNYDKYLLLKEERETLMQKQYQMQQVEIAEMEDFIARNLVRASTTGRAQSRRKALERMDKLEAPKLPPKPPFIRFKHQRDPVKDVLEVENLALKVGEGEDEKELFEHVSFKLNRGNKIALIGFNGVGKSTMLKALIGKIKPLEGSITWGRNTDISYFDQGEGDMGLTKTVLHELWDAYPRETENSIRSVLGQAGLRGEDVFKKVGSLSGGERARLKFAHFMMSCGNVLLMDEPTNHLDLPTKEVLDTALQEYTGTLLVVSHDRYLLNKFPDMIAELTPTGLHIYQGKYDDYKEAMDKKASMENELLAKEQEQGRREILEDKKRSSYRTKEERREAAERRQQLSYLEGLIEDLEPQIAELEEQILQPEIATNYQLMEEKYRSLEEKKQQLDNALSEWAELSDE